MASKSKSLLFHYLSRECFLECAFWCVFSCLFSFELLGWGEGIYQFNDAQVVTCCLPHQNRIINTLPCIFISVDFLLMTHPKKLHIIDCCFVWTQWNPPKLLQAWQCLAHELLVPFGSLQHIDGDLRIWKNLLNYFVAVHMVLYFQEIIL